MTRLLVLLFALATPATAEPFHCPEPRIAKDVDSGTCADGRGFRIGVGTPNNMWFDGLELRCPGGKLGKVALQSELDAGTPMTSIYTATGKHAMARGRFVVRLGDFAERMDGTLGRVVRASEYEHGTCEISP